MLLLHTQMKLHAPDAGPVCSHSEIFEKMLPLQGTRVLELGCGKAELTRAIARSGWGVSIIAMEVDKIQHALNLQHNDLSNVRFEEGGAEAIPVSDDTFDIVMMFKSLHHVPLDKLDRALHEIQRVLKPGGLAYIAEPVFAGDYNEILRIFNDEEKVRKAAFAALKRAVECGSMEMVKENFFQTPWTFKDFSDFEEKVLKVTHTHHHLTQNQFDLVRNKFMQHMTAKGAQFLLPMRADLLRKPSKNRFSN